MASPTTSPEPLSSYRPLQVLLIGLTLVTGMVDAVTYLDLGHVFSANLTGNIILLGLGAAGAGGMSTTSSLVAIVASLVGVTAGARLARSLEPLGHRWVATSLSVGAAVLVLALIATASRHVLGDYPALALLACGMGLNNATVNRVHIPGETTTVVLTTTLTTLVAGTQFPRGDLGTRARQMLSVAAILIGAICGAKLLYFGPLVAIGAGVAVAVVGTAAYVLTVLRYNARS
jgi:uncharacterized membrane protein YoaK (UPF0700 family)